MRRWHLTTPTGHQNHHAATRAGVRRAHRAHALLLVLGPTVTLRRPKFSRGRSTPTWRCAPPEGTARGLRARSPHRHGTSHHPRSPPFASRVKHLDTPSPQPECVASSPRTCSSSQRATHTSHARPPRPCARAHARVSSTRGRRLSLSARARAPSARRAAISPDSLPRATGAAAGPWKAMHVSRHTSPQLRDAGDKSTIT